ncbi:MAG: tol-pal system protein YbgF [Fibrobacter sp.]|nr:tol-pal system protein YbgF [Fibrobacter sp.]
MSRFKKNVTLPIFVCLAGCASSIRQVENEALLPEIDVIQVKENSDEALKLAQEAKLDVDVLSTKIMDLDNRVVVLSEEIASVSAAKIDELETRLALLIEAFKDLQAQLKALEARPVQVVSGSKKGSGPDPTFSPSSAASLISSPEYDAYQNALKVYNQRQYGKAIELFNDVVKQFPAGQYGDNSYFWIGESYYAQGDYASAIPAYQKVIMYPHSPKGDDAQLKIALSYLKMGQQGLAKEELKRLLDRYPASEFAPRAKKYLEEIK